MKSIKGKKNTREEELLTAEDQSSRILGEPAVQRHHVEEQHHRCQEANPPWSYRWSTLA